MSNIYSIYKVTNKLNGKVYIGFDKGWPKRVNSHICSSFNNNGIAYDYVFHRAIRKYGKDSFEWEVIYQSKERDHTLQIIEPYFIKEYNSFGQNGYNVSLGGEAPMLGRK